MKNKWMAIAGVAMTLMPISLFADTQKAQAQPQGCVYFREVTTGKTSIQKTVSIRGLGTNNWDTDFAVPVGTTFSYFIARVFPQNNANYQVTINLKYTNDTSSEVFRSSLPMTRMQLWSKIFRTPTVKQPVQINMNVGSDVNNVYSVAVLGCK